MYHPGLEGVIANETAISNVEGKQGAGGLEYRGYQIEDLAAGVSYLEAAYLLLHGDLPNRADLDAFEARIKAAEAPARAPGRACSARSRRATTRWTSCGPR